MSRRSNLAPKPITGVKSNLSPKVRNTMIVLSSIVIATIIITFGVLYGLPSSDAIVPNPVSSVSITTTPAIEAKIGNSTVTVSQKFGEYVVNANFSGSPLDTSLTFLSHEFQWSPLKPPIAEVIGTNTVSSILTANIAWLDFPGNTIRSFGSVNGNIGNVMCARNEFIFAGEMELVSNVVNSVRTSYSNVGLSFENPVEIFTASHQVGDIFMLNTTDNVVCISVSRFSNFERYAHYSSNMGLTWTPSNNFEAKDASSSSFGASSFQNHVGFIIYRGGIPPPFWLYESTDGGINFTPTLLPYDTENGVQPQITWGPSGVGYFTFSDWVSKRASVGYYDGFTWASQVLIPLQTLDMKIGSSLRAHISDDGLLTVVLQVESDGIYLYKATNVAATTWADRITIRAVNSGPLLRLESLYSIGNVKVLICTMTTAKYIIDENEDGTWNSPKLLSQSNKTVGHSLELPGKGTILLHGFDEVNTQYFQALPLLWDVNYNYNVLV